MEGLLSTGPTPSSFLYELQLNYKNHNQISIVLLCYCIESVSLSHVSFNGPSSFSDFQQMDTILLLVGGSCPECYSLCRSCLSLDLCYGPSLSSCCFLTLSNWKWCLGLLVSPYIFTQPVSCQVESISRYVRLYVPLPATCVSSRHSQKCVTLLKLTTELKTNFSLIGPIFPDI